MSGGGHDTQGASGIEKFAWNAFLFCAAVVALIVLGKFIYAEIKGIPLTFSSFQGVSNGAQNPPASQVQSQAPAPVTGASPASCPRVNDATQVRNTVCGANNLQFSWRGKSNICMLPKPPNAYLCRNAQTGMLAWYTP